MSLQGAWKTVLILISQVQKPADLDLQCLLFSKQVYPGAPGHRFIAQGYVMIDDGPIKWATAPIQKHVGS